MNVLNKLVLSPFEWSMSEQISASPMEFTVRLDCVGVVEKAKLEDAIVAELQRQPLLQANATVGSTHRESYWRPASNCLPDIRWFEGNPDDGSGFPDDFAPIDLENEIGFRFYGWRFQAGNQERIVMKFVYHHSCCDGKAGIEFVENTFCRYQCLVGEKAASSADLMDVDEQQILNRNLLAAKKLSLVDRIWSAFVIRPKRVGNMLLAKPRLLVKNAKGLNAGGPNGSHEKLFSDPPQLCSTELSVNETKRLGAFASKLSASSNTVLASKLFHALNDHLEGNAEHEGVIRGALRILIPFSLRDERHSQMPAANCVSMVYLEATEKILQADGSDNPVLVADLTRQIDFIRRWNLQYSWIESIESYAKVWPIVKLFKFGSGDRSMKSAPIATTVMTNLGRVFGGSGLVDSKGELAVNGVAANGATGARLEVKSVHVVPPCNATAAVNFSVNFYGNRLSLNAAYLPSLTDCETVEGLLGNWKRHIVDSVAGVPLDEIDS